MSVAGKTLAHRSLLLEYPDAERHRDHKRELSVQYKCETNELRENIEIVIRVANPMEERMLYQHMVAGDHQLYGPEAAQQMRDDQQHHGAEAVENKVVTRSKEAARARTSIETAT